MKVLAVASVVVILAGVSLFLFLPQRIIILDNPDSELNAAIRQSVPDLYVPEASTPTSTELSRNIPNLSAIISNNSSNDLPNQPRLTNPPEIVKGIYLTGWSAGSDSKLNYLLDLIAKKGLNAVVIDIKDYSGYVSYAVDVPEARASGAENQLRLSRPNALIKKLHDKNIYVIGRITVFQDPVLAKAHPEWALKNKTTGKVWTDKRGLAWLDAAAPPVWDYNIAIAKDALNRGFDEINFDYIRFVSDGDLSIISYPFWDQKIPRRKIIKNFFAYLRENLPEAKISADFFGLSTVDNWDDMGIGQVIEDAYPYFDYVDPMVYPSHYASEFLGYKNPAKYPYEVIKYSLEQALKRLKNYESGIMNNETSTTSTTAQIPNSSFIIHNSKLRPWLQAFDLGAVYNSAMIEQEVQAVKDVFNASSGTATDFAGWLFWDPANNYYSL